MTRGRSARAAAGGAEEDIGGDKALALLLLVFVGMTFREAMVPGKTMAATSRPWCGS